jgi:2-keto-4-pentenoate hydratase/2-oxohepta-3-ene-1,7-dioic acid hydratase in catechol pathway
VDRVVSYTSFAETIYPGSIIGTGTVGNGCGLEFGKSLNPGDKVELEIEGIGVLTNYIVS